MLKLKNYNALLQHFVIFLTLMLLVSCSEKNYFLPDRWKRNRHYWQNKEAIEFETVIKPYREKLDKELNEVLAYSPKTIDKIGDWQTPMGNLLSDITLKRSEPIFNSREKNQ